MKNEEKVNDIPKFTNDELADSDEEIIVLENTDGEKIEFETIDIVAYKSNLYAILQPKVLFDGMSEDEAFVFKLTREEDGNDRYEIVTDDNIINNVFKIYSKMIDKK